MKFLEKDLEEIIFNTDSQTLVERGLYFKGVKKRQLKIGNYGIADLVTIQRPSTLNASINFKEPVLITVVELKKDKVGISAFLQGINYIKGIKSYLTKRNVGFDFYFRLVLIGRELDTSGAFCYLPDIINNKDIYDFQLELKTYKYNVDGLLFLDHSEYSLIDEGFKL